MSSGNSVHTVRPIQGQGLGTWSFDLHKAWVYPFQLREDAVREMHRVATNNAKRMRVPVHLSVPLRRNFNV